MAFAWVQPLAHTQCWCNVVSVSTAGCYLKEHPFSRQSKALTVRMFGFCYWFFSAEYWMHSWGWILNLLNMTSICFLMKETRVLICEAKVLRQFSVMSHFSGMNENFQNGQYLKTPDLSKSPASVYDYHYFIAEWGAMLPVMRGARTNIQDQDGKADARCRVLFCRTAPSFALESCSCVRGANLCCLQICWPLLEFCCDAIE